MFERFTDRARRAVVLAQEEGRRLGHDYLGTEHLLLGLLAEGEGVGAQVLLAADFRLDEVREQIKTEVPPSTDPPGRHIPFTPRAKVVMEASLREALKLGHNYIGTEHLLLGMFADPNCLAAGLIERHGLTREAATTQVIDILRGLTETRPPSDRPSFRFRRRSGRAADRGSPELTPGMDDVLGRAAEIAGGGPVGTHHVLAAMIEASDLAASLVLEAGGFDAERLDVDPSEADVAGTRDEAPEAAAARATEVTTEDDDLVVRLSGSQRDRIVEALREGLLDDGSVRDELGKLWHRLSESINERRAERDTDQEAGPGEEPDTGPEQETDIGGDTEDEC